MTSEAGEVVEVCRRASGTHALRVGDSVPFRQSGPVTLPDVPLPRVSVLIHRAWYDERFATGVASVSQACGWQTWFTNLRGTPLGFMRTAFAGGIYQNRAIQITPEFVARQSDPAFCIVNSTPERPAWSHGPCAFVVQDNATIGRIALRHLHARGHRDVAFLNREHNYANQVRSKAFDDEAVKLGCRVHELEGDLLAPSDWLSTKLANLPSPLAVMTENDDIALTLARCCHEQGILVPERLAIIGVGDDPKICQHHDPPLSSVDTNPYEWGRQSALQLDRLLRGLEPPAKPLLIAPVGVTPRRSSERVHVGHPVIALALERLRVHRHDHHLNVTEMLNDCGMSRAALYRLFTRLVGHPPLAELHRLRLEDACGLLATSAKTLQQIAEECGFADASHLCRLFLKHMHMSPTEYRRGRMAGSRATDRASTR